tara:strand:- start:250 stop:2031 length:1782 start_codon:yes stop_codon:yes gene_type:complete
MKNIIFLIFFLAFHFSELIAQEYTLNEEVKIYYDKDWRPVEIKDSASYYRLITFKHKNIPLGIVSDYYLNDIKQSSFYATYVGLDSKGIDSLFLNGPSTMFYKNGKTKSLSYYLDNNKNFQQVWYYESGELSHTYNFEDNLKNGKRTSYHKTGEIESVVNYVNDMKQGEQIFYYHSGQIELISKFVNDLKEGLEIFYHENGNIAVERNFNKGKFNGELISYRSDGSKLALNYYLDGMRHGENIGYYRSGKIKWKKKYVDDKAQGIGYYYYESGSIWLVQNYVDGLQHGKENEYYESGELENKLNFVNGKKQGEFVSFYKSGEVKLISNYINGLRQGLLTQYLKNGKIDYTELYLDDNRVDRKIALVIGNANYEKGHLENPVNDANLIAESLKKLDFEVELHTNLSTRNEMLDAIKDFGRKRKDYEIGFVYYAGHGIQLNNNNYLLPVSEEFEYEEDVEDNGVSMQRVLRYLESTRENQLNFIVLDACRDNPFESNWNKTRSLKGGGLAKIPPPTGSLIAYSTDHGQTAADGNEGNSLYSKALAEKLLEEDVSIEQVFKNVRTEVLRLSNKSQSPVEESKLTGDVFYLNKKKVD